MEHYGNPATLMMRYIYWLKRRSMHGLGTNALLWLAYIYIVPFNDFVHSVAIEMRQ